MMNAFARSARRSLSWMAFGCLVFLALTLAACGSNAANSSNTASPSGNASSGSTAHDAKTSVMMISIKEGHDASGKDVYSFDPASITVKQGDTITIQNLSDELQDIDQGDAVKAGVDVVIPINQSGTMTFNVAGTFTIKSEKGATLTATVQ